MFDVLAPRLVKRHELPLGRGIALEGAGEELGLTVEAFAVPGKVALYLEKAEAGPDLGTQTGDTIGLKVTASGSGRAFYYVPGCAKVDADLARRLEGAELLGVPGLARDAAKLLLGLSEHFTVDVDDGY